MKEAEDFARPISCKIVMIGNSCVGKTSLVNAWVNGQFTSKTSPTIGANHLRKIVNIDGKNVDVCIWDTAGQEQYHSLAPLYTRAAAAAIAVASINDRESFEKLDMWLEMIEESCDDMPPVVLAVSKMDLANENSPSDSEIEQKYCGKFEGVFFTSALSGENVETLFVQSAKEGMKFLRSKGQIPSLDVCEEKDEKVKKNCC